MWFTAVQLHRQSADINVTTLRLAMAVNLEPLFSQQVRLAVAVRKL